MSSLRVFTTLVLLGLLVVGCATKIESEMNPELIDGDQAPVYDVISPL